MNDKQLLTTAMGLGIACGLLELYEAITFVEDVKRASTNAVRNVFIFIMPIVIIAAAISIRFGYIILGAGMIVVSLGIQHFLIDLAGRHFLALALGMAASFTAMAVQRKFDLVAIDHEERETAKKRISELGSSSTAAS